MNIAALKIVLRGSLSGGRRLLSSDSGFCGSAGILPGFCFLLTACGGEPDPYDVAAQVGEELIYEREIDKLAAARPGVSRQELLQALVDRKLLALEARARGLDRERAFTGRLAWEVREKTINSYQADRVNARIAVTGEELRQLFDRGGYGREKLLRRSRAETPEAAAELRRRILQDGAEAAGEDLGYLNRVGAARDGIPPQVFAELKPGTVSEPLPGEEGFTLIHCAAEREADFETYRGQLLESVRRERFVEEHLALIGELAREFRLRPAPAGFAILVARDPKAGIWPRFSPAEGRTPLFVYEGGEITVGEYVSSFRVAGEQPALGDSLGIYLAAWKLPVPKTLVWEAALAAGYLETEEIRSWRREREEVLLIAALRRAGKDRDIDRLAARLRRQHAGSIHLY
ncbi:MAG: hypothetical protein OXH50_11420 [Gemmatimonadetes bacterium]|nr:hypothetical protein [Gemmatimonadota bacterium]